MKGYNGYIYKPLYHSKKYMLVIMDNVKNYKGESQVFIIVLPRLKLETISLISNLWYYLTIVTATLHGLMEVMTC